MPLSPSSQERMRGPEHLNTRQRLDNLSREIRQQHPEEDAVAAANTLNIRRRPGQRRGYVDKRISDYFGKDAVERIQGAIGRMEQTIDGGLAAQLPSLGFTPVQEQAISKILQSLVAPGPDTVGVRSRSPYLTTRKIGRDEEGKRVTRYSVNMGNPYRSKDTYGNENPRSGIRRNQQYLRDIGRNASPQQKLFLRQLISALEEYAMRVDSRKVYMHDFHHKRHGAPIREETRKLGRLSVVLAGGAAAALTGAMSLFSGSLSVMPFLYSGVAMYAANPHLLDGKARRGAVQAGNLLNWKGFKDYRPQGQEWAQIIGQINQGNNAEVKAFLRRGSDANGAAVLNALAPEGTVSEGTRQQLKTMIENGDFAGFANRVRGVRDSDAKELVREYVERGAVKYAG